MLACCNAQRAAACCLLSSSSAESHLMMLGTNGECSSGGRRCAAGLVIVFRPRGHAGTLSLGGSDRSKLTTTRTDGKGVACKISMCGHLLKNLNPTCMLVHCMHSVHPNFPFLREPHTLEVRRNVSSHRTRATTARRRTRSLAMSYDPPGAAP